MTDRERCVNVMHYREVDQIPLWDFGFWEETLPTWEQQGYPAGADPQAYFQMDRGLGGFPVHLGMIPPFTPVKIAEDEISETVIDEAGVKQRRKKPGHGSSIPTFLEFPVKDRADWEEMKKRYDPRDERRRLADFEEHVRRANQRDYALQISCWGLFGTIRGWMGVENAALAFYDDPGMIQDMMEHIAYFVCELIHPVLDRVQVDVGAFWEDMAYNKTSLISPAHFKKYMVPAYQKITGLLREHGCDLAYVDCDGNIEELVPLWLEGGVNIMFPVEIGTWQADPWAWRRKYGRELRAMGAIGKRALAAGRREIDAEIERRRPLLEDGGFIPHPDHRVPPDVPLAHYQYYLDRMREILHRPYRF